MATLQILYNPGVSAPAFYALDGDPRTFTAWKGTGAEIFSYLLRTDRPSLYFKSGPGNSDWTEVGSSGWPAFQTKTTYVYARPTGNDNTGDGTLTNPYRTFQKAVTALPRQVDPGNRWIVDVSDLGTEVLPPNYTLPAIDAPFGLDFSSAFGPDAIYPFQIGTAVEIVAIPKLAVGVVQAIDANLQGPGTPGYGPGVYLDPSTNLIEIHVTAGLYPTDSLKGLLLQSYWGTCGAIQRNVDVGGVHVIYTSRATVFEEWVSPMFSSPAFFPFAPAPPFTIREQSTQLTTTNNPGDLIKPGFGIAGSGSIGVRGIKFRQAAPNPTSFPVQTFGSRTIFWENCDLDGFGAFHGTGCNIFLSSVMRNGSFASQVPICWISSMFLNMAAINPGWSTPGVFLGLGFVVRDSVALGVRLDALTPAGRGPMYDMQLRNGVIYGSVEDTNYAQIADPANFPAPFFPGSLAPALRTPGHGVLLRGGKAVIDHVKIFGVAADAIHIEAAFGLVEIKSVTGGEGGLVYGLPNVNGGAGNRGLLLDDGAHVRCEDNDPNPGLPTTVTAVGGDFKVGTLPVGTWAAFHVAKNEYDITAVGAGGATGTGSRLFEKP